MKMNNYYKKQEVLEMKKIKVFSVVAILTSMILVAVAESNISYYEDSETVKGHISADPNADIVFASDKMVPPSTDLPSPLDSNLESEGLNSYTITHKTNILYGKNGAYAWDTKTEHWGHSNPDENNPDLVEWGWETTTEHVEVLEFNQANRPIHMKSVSTDELGNNTESEIWMQYEDGRLSYQKTISTNAEGETTTQIQNNMKYDEYGRVASMDISVTDADVTTTTIRRYNMRYNDDGLLKYYQDDITNADGTKVYTDTSQAYYSDGKVKHSETSERKVGAN